MNEFVLFVVKSKKANKTNSLAHFLGESMVRPNCFWFYLNFISLVDNFGKMYEEIEIFCYTLV